MTRPCFIITGCILFIIIPMLFSGPITWDVTIISQSVQLILMSSFAFSLLPKDRAGYRVTVLLFSIWYCVDLIQYVLWLILSTGTLYPLVINTVFASIVTYHLLRPRYFKSNKVNPDNIHILLYRPTRPFMMLHSLIGLPIASVAVYCHGGLWSFEYSQKKYVFREMSPEAMQRSRYIIHDTGIKTCDHHVNMLLNLLGESSIFLGVRCKCVWVIRHFLSELGDKYRPNFLEYQPSIYAIKILENDRKRPGSV